MIRIGSEGDFLDGLGAIGSALDEELAPFPDQVLWARFEQICGELLRFFAYLAGSDRRGRTRGWSRARGVRAEPVRRGIGIAFFHRDIVFGDS